jgi:hypothetical protein
VNPSLHEWLAACAAHSGMLGCGIRQPDATGFSHTAEEIFPHQRMDEALNFLADAFASFQERGLAPRWLTWTFEKGRVRLVARPDGLLLALAAQPDSVAAQNLDQLAEEFLALKFTD